MGRREHLNLHHSEKTILPLQAQATQPIYKALPPKHFFHCQKIAFLTMKNMKMIIISFGRKLQQLCSWSWFLIIYFYRFVLLRASPFCIQLFYFLFVSSIGYGVLKSLKPRTPNFTPRNLDLFFTSVSAATVSSMSTIEMEVFSNTQLMILAVLMFIGGEVFTSMMGLHLRRWCKLNRSAKDESRVNDSSYDLDIPRLSFHDQVELGVVTRPDFDSSKSDIFEFEGEHMSFETADFKYKSIEFLGYVVLGYLLVIHLFGVISVLTYVTTISSAKNVLKSKGLKGLTFSLFTTISTFASCGFIPTNENMIVFSKNSGLLLLLIPQVLLGNTLFPSFLRFTIWSLGKFVKKGEANYLLKNTSDTGYLHLLPCLHSSYLVVTVVGFIAIQFVLFCSLEWDSNGLSDLNTYQKIVGVLFQTVNTRHTGETIVDISTVASAILVLFVVMMYLPPYTSFLPLNNNQENLRGKKGKGRRKLVENLIFSQLSYLVIFILLVCITERKKMKEDPLNFNVLNIVVEVISAYGNVGFTTGYSCDRRLKQDGICENKWFGFSGKWSDGGKLILIVVMFFGRLKKFNMNGGRAWKLL